MTLSNSGLENKLSAEIKAFYLRSPIRRYALLFIFFMLILELFLLGIFQFFVSREIEAERKKSFLTAWENYLFQKWKVDYSKITGYIWWENLWKKINGREAEIDRAFREDPSIREEYDGFWVYLKPYFPLVEIEGKDSPKIHLSAHLVEKLYQTQSLKSGTLHLILPLQEDDLYLVSVSALCDNTGKPYTSGIAIFAFSLNKFLQLAEEVLPVKLELQKGKDTSQFYYTFSIPDKLNLGFQYFISVTPKQSIKKLLLYTILFFLTTQLVLSSILFAILATDYSRTRTVELQKLVDSSENLNLSLSEKVQELAKLNNLLEKSEAKYKHLVESSKDLIFSFDKNGFILTVNKTMEEILGVKSSHLIGKFFLDLSYNPDKKIETLEKQILMEKFEELKENKSSVSFEMAFETKNKEPLYLDVKWDYVPIGNNFVVFGKAFTFRDDPMLKYFLSEKKIYLIQNYITHAEQISQRITNHIRKYCDTQDFFNIRLCVREMLINAIEHGNLEIDFDTKSKAKENKNYFQFLRERQKNPKFSKRKVLIYYFLTPKKVSYLIKDEGNGFDHKTFIEQKLKSAGDDLLSHGRGILLTLQTFDIVRYNSKGNQVYLCKYWKQKS